MEEQIAIPLPETITVVTINSHNLRAIMGRPLFTELFPTGLLSEERPPQPVSFAMLVELLFDVFSGHIIQCEIIFTRDTNQDDILALSSELTKRFRGILFTFYGQIFPHRVIFRK